MTATSGRRSASFRFGLDSRSFLTLLSVILYILLFFVPECMCKSHNSHLSLNLSRAHVPYFLHSNKQMAKKCETAKNCPYKEALKKSKKVCWGYESDCGLTDRSYSWKHLKCTERSRWTGVSTPVEQRQTFWRQADFGYVREHLNSIVDICSSKLPHESSLVCSQHLRYCYGRNIYFDFKHFRATESSVMYRSDIIKDGDVGGNCVLDSDALKSRADQTGYLQSWAAELVHFVNRSDFRMNRQWCDVIFEKPVIIMKLDAGVSMYHHFCDFVNLYASQHINGSFDQSVPVILWDTTFYGYRDLFSAMWQVFSIHKPIQLKDLDGKRVCFREVMMPLLARMFFGLYYNMPLIGGCYGSGLIHAFSKHVLHRMHIRQTGPLPDKIRVTLLSRDSKYRRILNEQKIIERFDAIEDIQFTHVTYSHHMPFEQQLTYTHNSDVFISVHGSGLTHLLFLPDWASVIEIYNCGDAECYMDLARLRGVKYYTWEDEKKVKLENATVQNRKFTNFVLQPDEFMRITLRAVDHVRSDKLFIKQRQRFNRKLLEKTEL